MTKSERVEFLKSCTQRQRSKYYTDVAFLGCVACGAPWTPQGAERTSLHHPSGHGFPEPRKYTPVMGLCYTTCHQLGKQSLHGGKKTFVQKNGSQEYLLGKVEARLEAQ